jgi:pimeloyl-ACP methyl ester carboxylesterase
MRTSLLLLLFFTTNQVCGQVRKPEDLGYRHLRTVFKGDTVHVLVLSKRGEEHRRKPLFLLDQGSLPKPLIITDDQGAFGVFPFRTDSLLEEYHLAIIGKPAVPVVAPAASLKPGYLYADPATGRAPEGYLSRDHPGYYVSRNRAILRFLRKQPWFDGRRLVLAGHSAGTTVMTRLAARSKRVTHLILSNGNPLGRIVTMLGPPRAADTTGAAAEEIFRYWEAVVARPGDKSDPGGGDTNYTMYQFSLPIVADLKKLRIPVLITYGTRDYCAPYNDYLRVELIRERKKNVYFKAYPGLEHNYFGLKPDGSRDYDNFNWDRVAADWQAWLRKQ